MALPVTSERREGRNDPTAPAGWSHLAARAALLLAALYPAALVVTIAAFLIIGERWWVTAVALYLPRIGFALPLPVLLLALWATGSRRRVWALLGVSVPLLLILMGFVLPWPVWADANAPAVRVMSYNVNSEIGGEDAVVQEIDGFSPDIALLEEHGGSDKIVSLLQARYAAVHVSGQFIVASRFPITSTLDPEKIPYNGRLRSPRWVEAVIATPLGSITFYEVHPLSPREGLASVRGNGIKHEIRVAIGFSRDSEDIVRTNNGLRALQVEDIAGAAQQEKGPVVIAGDTNLPALSAVLHRFLSGFQDGFSKASWGLGYTFPTTRIPWMRIDRILANDELRFVRFQVGRSRASDHRCVVADLQRAK
jgi:endonuclease/exonuclease/phosphatase (EEP) superfamily protein YafD